MQNDSLIRPIEKWFWGQKREDLTHWANRSQRNTPTTETRFWMHWPKIHASQGKLWTNWRNQKKLKKHARVQLHPYAHPTPILVATIFCMWGRTVDVIKHTRFQVNRFRGFWAPGAENDHLHWLGTSSYYRAAYALTCCTVMCFYSAHLVLTMMCAGRWQSANHSRRKTNRCCDWPADRGLREFSGGSKTD